MSISKRHVDANTEPISFDAQTLGRAHEDESPYIDMVRFRNLIVHEYEAINPEILYELATGRLSDFRKFRDELDKGT